MRMDDLLRLNPNCCYEACAGCKSVLRLAEFQSRHPADWPDRLVGSPRQLAGIGVPSKATPAVGEAGPRCEECGGFDAINFAGTWVCPGCCTARGTCCAGNE
jgi:hypothetical protein